MPSEGQHRALQGRLGVGRGAALRVQRPALGQRPAGAAQKLDLAPRRDRGREVEGVGLAPLAREGEGEGVGAHKRRGAPCRRHGRIARAHRDGGEAALRQRLHLGPEGGEVVAVVDDQRREAQRAGAVRERRQARLERGGREAAPRVHPHDGAVVRRQDGHGHRVHLARGQRAQAPLDAVDPVRGAGVALPLRDDAARGPGLQVREPRAKESARHPRLEVGRRDAKRRLGHGIAPSGRGPRQGAGACGRSLCWNGAVASAAPAAGRQRPRAPDPACSRPRPPARRCGARAPAPPRTAPATGLATPLALRAHRDP